jgi:hypothetical protein
MWWRETLDAAATHAKLGARVPGRASIVATLIHRILLDNWT